MPSLILESRPSSKDSRGSRGSSRNSVVEDNYRASYFPGYSEKPLDEQLEPIAVIGMGCRLPGDVASPADFWNLMMKKGTGQTPKVPSSRFNIDAHFHKNNDRPGSFGRKLLEVVYEALESGGVSLEAISGTRTAMSFKESSFRHSLSATGVDPGIISNRISHVFNLNGPSIMCNTACSSSVYALHNACNALRNHEAEGAIVGGVNLIITVDQHMNTAKLGVLSPTSTCHTFDITADGYGRADAVGAVYLKRLSDAVRDGDPIRGVIRSSATNSNGKVPAADVIGHAYKRGGDLDPRLTGYFECHGTGTAIGDPIEVEAVSIAMNKGLKTNIGHSEAASGLSALIKAILMVERGVIAPTRGLVTPNPKIKWDDWQVKVVTEPTPFAAHLPVRRVSINSFGYGGTNAHIIVEAAESLLEKEQTYKFIDNTTDKRPRQAPRRAAHRKRPFLLPFSAHDKPTLLRNITAHGKIVNDYDLIDLSYTLSTRRSSLQSKGFAVVSHSNLKSVFDNVSTSFTFAEKKKTPTLGFVFTGQGAQWACMGADLMKNSYRFLRSIRTLDLALEELHDGPSWSIEDVLLEPPETSRVNEAEYSQPLCTAVQISLVQLLEYWGIKPVVTVGHSSGEMAAAFAAGLISAREAITLAYYRGVVTREVNTDGAMMAVGLGAEAVSPYLEGVKDKVVVACHNSPSGVTLSGDAGALEEVRVELTKKEIFARVVKTNGKAYHSHHMAPVSAKYEKLVRAAKKYAKFDPATPSSAKMVSSVTNRVLPEMATLDETYWSKNLRSPVLFNQAVQTILTSDEFSNVELFVEIGPHSALKGPIQQIKAEMKAKFEYLPTLLRGADSAVQLLSLAGEMFLRSYPMNKERVAHAYVDEPSHGGKLSTTKGSIIVDLPPYQWNYARPLWAENRASREQRLPKFPRHDVLGQLVIGASLAEPTWRNVLRTRDLPWLKDHSLGGEVVFPAAGYFAMAMEAVTQLNELSESPIAIESYVLRDISIQKALVTPDNDEGIEVLLNLRPSVYGGESKTTWWDFGVSSIDGEGVIKEHMAGSIAINARPRGNKPREIPQGTQRASGKAWNEALREVGFDYGPTFQDMEDVRFDGKNYWCSCSTNIKKQVDESLGESRYPLHPAAIDSVLQLSIAAIHAGRTNAMDYGAIPIQVDEVTIWPPTEAQVENTKALGYAWCDQRGIRNFNTSAQMTAYDGELVVEVTNLRCVSYEAAVPQKPPSALTEAPYGEMVWGVDFDSLKTASDIDGLSIADLVNLALFKHPGKKVLHVGSSDARNILQKSPRAAYTIIARTDAEADALKTSLEEYQSATVLKPAEASSLAEGSYDILAVDQGAYTIGDILPAAWKALKLHGSAFIDYSDEFRKVGTEGLEITIHNSSTGSTIARKVTPAVNGVNGHANGIKKPSRTVQLVFRESQAAIVSSVRLALEALGWDIQVCRLDACVESGVKEHVIILADFERPLLYTVTKNEFECIQAIIDSTSSLLWVTAGGLLEGKQPEFAMVSGLARTVTSEQASLDFRTIDVDLENVTLDSAVDTIVEVARKQEKADEEIPDREFCLSQGKRYISRLVRNHDLNSLFSSTGPKPKAFRPGEHISGKVVGGKVIFQEEAATEDELKPGHVQVQVQASGLTKEGVLVITGSDYPTTFSHEVGGIVRKVGAGVSGLKPGDVVVGFHADTFASYQQIPASMLNKLDSNDDLDEAVGVLAAYSTALYGLETLAGIQPNEKVLILPNTGASGIAAAKIAQNKGAIPYVVTKTAHEVAFLEKHLKLDARRQIIELSGNASIYEQIRGLTGGHGADVVFSAGSTDIDASREAWRSIARFGRFLDSGRKDALRRSALYGVPAQRGACYMPFDILDIYEDRPQILSSLFPTVLGMLRQGSIVPPSSTQHSVNLADLDKAVARFSDAFGASRPIIKYEASESPVMVVPARAPLKFSPDATYLLVGCLGGLGRSLTSLMMKSGARRFVFLSRSGTDAPAAAKLVKDIEGAGAITQVVRGDATSREDVVRAVQGIPSEYPIKGVVHAAMVLRDGLFESMTFENWRTTVEPKIAGAANLHSVLANEPLDFFLMTSSVSGVLGNPAQSNYAAANTYLDSLARHRAASGKTATSLVLPMILEVGVVSENNDLEQALKRKGMYGIGEAELLESFEAGILSATKLEGTAPDHIVVGLDPARLKKAISDAAVTDSYWLEDARFKQAVHDINSAEGTGGSSGGSGQDIISTIAAAASPAEAVDAVTEHFIAKLARMLLLEDDAFEPSVKSISSYGIDSMIGAELRKWIFKEYKMDVPFQQLLGPTLTVTKFAGQVCASRGIEVAA
ncbi:KR domain-containing protein [Durotheca rogersii]|uniref:KR domain-containing protein n=1 Tax=Durotheca rogersii TaxID=419775 RepID=UPI00221E591B|nr:KR domain-containing protein [Durotheca rogersii]KAI5867271.1 KR domain-containing protein [Durotheca rogersii]